MDLSFCQPTTALSQTCYNLKEGNVTNQIGAGLLNISTDMNSVTNNVCGKIGFADICAGLKYDGSGLTPTFSVGASLSGYSMNLQYSSQSATCVTKSINGSLVTTCDNDVTTTLTMGPTNDISKASPLNDLENISIDNLNNYLEEINYKLSSVEIKSRNILGTLGVKQNEIDKIFATNIISKVNPLIVQANEIINAQKIAKPDCSFFDIIHSIGASDLDKNELFNVSIQSNGDSNLKWSVDMSKGPMGEIKPDCCQMANKTGLDISYHLCHKIDWCRLCNIKFRFEYFVLVPLHHLTYYN